MHWMDEITKIAAVIMTAWGALALILGPVVFFRARKYFPERAEAITPIQLQAAVDGLDYRLREAYTAEVGRLRLSADEHHREVMDTLRSVQTRAEAAYERSKDAMHKAEMVEERVTGLDRALMGRMEGIQETLTQLRQIRRGDPA